jgi:hypothetical protein
LPPLFSAVLAKGRRQIRALDANAVSHNDPLSTSRSITGVRFTIMGATSFPGRNIPSPLNETNRSQVALLILNDGRFAAEGSPAGLKKGVGRF